MRGLFLILLTFALCGCIRKDLYYGVISLPGIINVSADWRDIEEIPGGIVVYLYPEGDSINIENTIPMVEYIPNRGSSISLPYGSYYGLIYNDYTEDLLFRNMEKRQNAEAYLRRNTDLPFSKRTSLTKSVGCVESFYNAQIGSFTISEESPSFSITVQPKLKTLHIDLKISLTGGKNIAYARGSLSGVNKSMNLSTGSPIKENVADVVFDFEIINDTIKAELECFGLKNLNTTNNSDLTTIIHNNLEIAFILKDGSQIIGNHIFDITDIIKQIVPVEKDGVCDDIFIELNEANIVIPDVKESDDGFDIDVGDWDDIIIKELY